MLGSIALFGPLGARERARLLIENHPLVRRVDAAPGAARLRLFLAAPISEDELVTLLEDSGISGFAFGP